MTPEEFTAWRNIATAPCIVGVLLSLVVVLGREWVKSDLRDRMCEPIKVRWRPFTWRTNWATCSFKVVYSDFHGQIHRANCWTSWYYRSVKWDEDEIIG